jgi:GNAT superfamily N-acetyltransferase
MDTHLRFRLATPLDAALLAPLNAQLIRDEGHRNSMTIAELELRMADWLRGEYRAVIFELASLVIGYALFRCEPEHVYLRQLFVAPAHRRRGVARAALRWLWRNAWADASRVRIDVLMDNLEGQAFWRAVGFGEYCITMEMEPPGAR